jgi:hypothetical protein
MEKKDCNVELESLGEMAIASQKSTSNAPTQRGHVGLVQLPCDILTEIVLNLVAPPHECDLHTLRAANLDILELTCVHSAMKAVGLRYLSVCCAILLDYELTPEEERVVCPHQEVITLHPRPPSGADVNFYRKRILWVSWGEKLCNKEISEPITEIHLGVMQSITSLVSQYAQLNEIFVEIPLTCNQLSAILQFCQFSLHKLDCLLYDEIKNDVYDVPALPELRDLKIRFYRKQMCVRDEQVRLQHCSQCLSAFIRSVTRKLYKAIVSEGKLENDIVNAFASLNGLQELQILDESYQVQHSRSKPAETVHSIHTLALPFRHWSSFYPENCQALRNLNIFCKDSGSDLKTFNFMHLRYLSVGFPLNSHQLGELGRLNNLERLNLMLVTDQNPPGYEIPLRYKDVNTKAFPRLRNLRMDQYYFGYMLQMELLNLSSLTLLSLPMIVQGPNEGWLEIPDIPWCHQLTDLDINADGKYAMWGHSHACFTKLEIFHLSVSLFDATVQCQFPTLKKLLFSHGDVLPYLELTPSRFPNLSVIESGVGNVKEPIEVPLQRLIAVEISLEVFNHLMKTDHIETVEFTYVTRWNCSTINLFWHNTRSSRCLWNWIGHLEDEVSCIREVNLTILSPKLLLQKMLRAVHWIRYKLDLDDDAEFQKDDAGNTKYISISIFIPLELSQLQHTPKFKELESSLQEFGWCTIELIKSGE